MSLKKLKDYENNDIQVESAIKDAKGQSIHSTYQEKLTTTSVSDGTINKVIGFDTNGDIVKGAQSSGGMTNPMSAAGDIIIGGSSGTPTRLAKGTAGQVLTMNSGATAPEWQTPSGGGSSGVSSIGGETGAISVSGLVAEDSTLSNPFRVMQHRISGLFDSVSTLDYINLPVVFLSRISDSIATYKNYASTLIPLVGIQYYAQGFVDVICSSINNLCGFGIDFSAAIDARTTQCNLVITSITFLDSNGDTTTANSAVDFKFELGDGSSTYAYSKPFLSTNWTDTVTPVENISMQEMIEDFLNN